MSHEKVVPLGRLLECCTPRPAGGLVLCHGCFDLLHVGHVKHLRAAKGLGTVLAVTVTADRFVNKGVNRPFFPQEIRAEVLAALADVDYVAVNDYPTAVEAISLLRPDVYVKGPECAWDISPGFLAEREMVERVGGRVVFTNGEVYSSTVLLERVLGSGYGR